MRYHIIWLFEYKNKKEIKGGVSSKRKGKLIENNGGFKLDKKGYFSCMLEKLLNKLFPAEWKEIRINEVILRHINRFK